MSDLNQESAENAEKPGREGGTPGFDLEAEEGMIEAGSEAKPGREGGTVG